MSPRIPALLGCAGLAFGLILNSHVWAEGESAVPPIITHSETLFEIGGVKFDKAARTVTFPARVQMASGTVEYLLVGEEGKTHESLLATSVEPYSVHMAMLLLGAKGAPASNVSLTPEKIDDAYLQDAPEIQGEKIGLLVSWEKEGKQHQVEASECLLMKSKPMQSGPWTYNGSLLYEGRFLAQEQRSFVSVITDPAALINNPRPGRENDEIWSINQKVIPAVDTPVQVTIQLPPRATP